MQKRGLVIALVLGVLFVSLAFASAFSFSDFFSNLFGNSVTGNVVESDTVSDLNPRTNPFTISTWINTSDASSLQSIVSKWKQTSSGFLGFEVAINNWGSGTCNATGKVCFFDGSSGVFGVDSGIQANKLYHLAVVRDGTLITFYVNGVNKGTATVSSNIGDLTGIATSIGRSSYAQPYSSANAASWVNFIRVFKGTIKNSNGEANKVNFYNRALNADEISALYSDCISACSGKVCGVNACGGSCGTCATGKQCNSNGACIDIPVQCVENWSCDWGTCIDSQQTGLCRDTNNCGTTTNKPVSPKTCSVCSDSDNGMDFAVKGHTRGTCKNCASITTNDEWDFCKDTKNLTEYGCTSDSYFNQTNYSCPEKCLDGRCVPMTTLATCIDGGKILDKDIAGTVSLKICRDFDCTTSLYADFCANESIVNETSCGVDKVKYTELECGEGKMCLNTPGVGARCILSGTPTSTISGLNPLNNSFTISAVINTTSATAVQSIFSRWYFDSSKAPHGFELVLNYPSVTMISFWDGVNEWRGVVSGIKVGKLYHVAIVREGTKLTFYINGGSVGEISINATIPDASVALPIVGRSNYNLPKSTNPQYYDLFTRPFVGVIKNSTEANPGVDLYDRALSASEIIALYNRFIPPVPGCTPDWNCSDWGNCVNNRQNKICSDKNNCNIIAGRPIDTQTCISCIDSDGGKNFFINGTTYNGTTITDTCNGKTLTEGYCNTTVASSTILKECASGCYNGACYYNLGDSVELTSKDAINLKKNNTYYYSISLKSVLNLTSAQVVIDGLIPFDYVTTGKLYKLDDGNYLTITSITRAANIGDKDKVVFTIEETTSLLQRLLEWIKQLLGSK